MFPIFWQEEMREKIKRKKERKKEREEREREKQGKMQSNRAFFLVEKKKVNPVFWNGFKHSLTGYKRIYTEHA